MIYEDLDRLSSRLSQLAQLVQTFALDNQTLRLQLSDQQQENVRLQQVMQATLAELEVTLDTLPLPPALCVNTSHLSSADKLPATVEPNHSSAPTNVAPAAAVTDNTGNTASAASGTDASLKTTAVKSSASAARTARPATVASSRSRNSVPA